MNTAYQIDSDSFTALKLRVERMGVHKMYSVNTSVLWFTVLVHNKDLLAHFIITLQPTAQCNQSAYKHGFQTFYADK